MITPEQLKTATEIQTNISWYSISSWGGKIIINSTGEWIDATLNEWRRYIIANNLHDNFRLKIKEA